MSAAEDRNRTILAQAARRLEQLSRATLPAGPAAAVADTPAVHPLPRPAEPEPFAGEPLQARRSVAIDLQALARRGYVSPDGARTPIAEQLRVIKRPLLANARGQSAGPVARGNLIMITSAMEGEGKTYSAINLAISMAAEHDTSVILVDGDAARPSVMSRLGLAEDKGLTDALRDPEAELEEFLLATNISGLALLPVGTHRAGTSELLTSEAMSKRLHQLERGQGRQVVVFDGPPLLQASEAGRLAAQVGQVVVVVEAEKTKEAALRDALAMLEGCPVVSLLLNKARTSRFAPSSSYGYGY